MTIPLVKMYIYISVFLFIIGLEGVRALQFHVGWLEAKLSFRIKILREEMGAGTSV